MYYKARIYKDTIFLLDLLILSVLLTVVRNHAPNLTFLLKNETSLPEISAPKQ